MRDYAAPAQTGAVHAPPAGRIEAKGRVDCNGGKKNSA